MYVNNDILHLLNCVWSKLINDDLPSSQWYRTDENICSLLIYCWINYAFSNWYYMHELFFNWNLYFRERKLHLKVWRGVCLRCRWLIFRLTLMRKGLLYLLFFKLDILLIFYVKLFAVQLYESKLSDFCIVSNCIYYMLQYKIGFF